MIYQYECECGHYFEAFNSISNRRIAQCPNCNSWEVSKLISAPAVSVPQGGLRDKAGERIWFPGPYFDKGLRRRFNTEEEKKKFMDEQNIVNTGESDAKVKKQRNDYHDKMMVTDKKYKKENKNIMKGADKWEKNQ